MKKSDFIISLSKNLDDYNEIDVSLSADIIQNAIIEALKKRKRVEIRGFGTFSKKYIRPRKFVNPKTKKISYLGETATMHFKPSKSLVKK